MKMKWEKLIFHWEKWSFEPTGNSVHTIEIVTLEKALLARVYLKPCVRYFFIKSLFFIEWQPFKCYEKCFYFAEKGLLDLEILNFFFILFFLFFIFYCPLFFPVSHCFKVWSKKNIKVYDVINCLKMNLITHFVWYLEKETRCDIETLSIGREWNKEHFYWKMMQKICTKS